MESNFLGQASKVIQDTSILRRLLFAASVLPEATPHLWEIVAIFAVHKTKMSLLPSQARILSENIAFCDPDSLTTDKDLLRELVFMPYDKKDHLGVILISNKEKCSICDGNLLLRADRPSNVTLYTDANGTLPATHYRKYCQKKSCSVVQHYGYYTTGSASNVHYDLDWKEQTYLLSSHETGFELNLLARFDVELLIGQMSYKQKADIYNEVNKYDDKKKKCSSDDRELCDDLDNDDEYVLKA